MNSSDKNPFVRCESWVFSKLFHTGKFRVPWHQRHYDWKKEHVSDLLRDIDEAVQQGRECYFLGSVMLVQKNNNLWEINDGQQRMVTFSLICAYLSRLFHKENESRCEGYALRVIFNLNDSHLENLSDADDLEPRLLPPRDDKTRYNLMIRGKSIGTNGKLTTAWREIDSFVSAMGLEKSKTFLDFLLNRVEIACLYIPEEHVSPNSVFETINCRGKQLEDFDLIRNDLYSYLSSEKSQARRDTAHENIERIRAQISNDKKAADYFRCYFQCRYGFLPKGSFYRITRQKIRLKSDKRERPSDYVFDLIDDFSSKEHVDLFRLIISPDSNSRFIEGFSRDSRTQKSIRGLSILLHELNNYTVVQSMTFAFLCRYLKESDSQKKKWTAKFVYKSIRSITSFVMRTAFVVAKFEPSHFESEFSAFAEKIWSARSLDDLNIESFLRECDNSNEGIMNDSKFRDKASGLEMKSNPKTKTFLVGLNHYNQQDRDIINSKKCTVEHIFPRSSQHWPGWKNFQGDSEGWPDRLGNLTLLGESDNKPGDSANQSFANKKQFLSRSAINLNREISDKDSWSPAEIERRQKKLAKLATKVWDFK